MGQHRNLKDQRDRLRLATHVKNIYTRNCRQHNRFWGLVVDDVLALIDKNCHYCDRRPNNHARGWAYQGIDRKNNRRGYELGNVVPCCADCNAVKGNRLTYEEMLVVGKTLQDHRKKKGG